MGWFPANESGACVQYSRSAVPFEEITCLYPGLKRLYFNWEFTMDPESLFHKMDENPWFPVTCCVVYLIAMHFGQKYFEKREKWQWRTTLALWNLFLSTFSIIGFSRLAPKLIHNISTYGWFGFLCINPESTLGPGTSGLWAILFVLSKPAELLDTFFIIIHKKPLMLLHWYHHITVLLCTWHTTVTRCPPGLFYATMNYAVHGIMYFYYFLMAIRCKPKWFNPKVITIAQIAQMVAGVGASASAFWAINTVDGCWSKFENNTGTLVMYGSYLVLFLQFFFRRYFISVTKKPKRE